MAGGGGGVPFGVLASLPLTTYRGAPVPQSAYLHHIFPNLKAAEESWVTHAETKQE